MSWTRSDIETLNYLERPTVRARIGGMERPAEIWPDGNNVFVVSRAGRSCSELRVSWGLLLEVLNDPRAAPIEIETAHRERLPAVPTT